MGMIELADVLKAARTLNERTVQLGQLGFAEHADLLTEAIAIKRMATEVAIRSVNGSDAYNYAVDFKNRADAVANMLRGRLASGAAAMPSTI
jgi:hypothetical protein